MNNTQAFTGLEDKYQKYRPSYPIQALESLHAFIEAGRNESWPSPANLIDVGAGTGILTRQLRDRFGATFRCTGVEPNDAMRGRAEADTDPALQIAYVGGTAEEIPVPSRSGVLVIAAQAAHWFDRPRFYAEAARILCAGGVLALLYNYRNWRRDPFLAAYEDFLEEGNPKYRRAPLLAPTNREEIGHEQSRRRELDYELRRLEQFRDFTEFSFEWQRGMSADEFIGMCLSTVDFRRAIGNVDDEVAVSTLRKLMTSHDRGGPRIVVPYVTTLLAVRRT